MRTTTRLAAAAAVVLLAVAGCAAADDGDDQATDAATAAATPQGEAPAMPEPDLDGLPEVIAEVNGTQISLADFTMAYESQFQQQAMQAQMAGQELDQDVLRSQTADVLVDTELLVQESDARQLTVAPAEIDATLDELTEANGLASTDELLALFEEQGMAQDEVRSQLESQLELDQLYADEGGDFTPSEEELQALYDEAVTQQPPAAQGEAAPELPSFEEVRPQLDQQLTQQHQAEAVEALLTELRESADIQIHL